MKIAANLQSCLPAESLPCGLYRIPPRSLNLDSVIKLIPVQTHAELL